MKKLKQTEEPIRIQHPSQDPALETKDRSTQKMRTKVFAPYVIEIILKRSVPASANTVTKWDTSIEIAQVPQTRVKPVTEEDPPVGKTTKTTIDQSQETKVEKQEVHTPKTTKNPNNTSQAATNMASPKKRKHQPQMPLALTTKTWKMMNQSEEERETKPTESQTHPEELGDNQTPPHHSKSQYIQSQTADKMGEKIQG